MPGVGDPDAGGARIGVRYATPVGVQVAGLARGYYRQSRQVPVRRKGCSRPHGSGGSLEAVLGGALSLTDDIMLVLLPTPLGAGPCGPKGCGVVATWEAG